MLTANRTRTSVLAISAAMIAGGLWLSYLGPSRSADADKPIWTAFYVNQQDLPVRRSRAPDAEIIARLGKGHTIQMQVQKDKEQQLLDQSKWLKIPPSEPLLDEFWAPSRITPGGWVETEALVGLGEFKKVTSWPFRYLIIDLELHSLSYCFSADGSITAYLASSEYPSDTKTYREYLYIANEILISGSKGRPEASRSVALFDKKNNRLCPPGYVGIRCDQFLEEERQKKLGGFNWRFASFGDKRKHVIETDKEFCKR